MTNPSFITSEQIDELVSGALADPSIDLALPLALSFSMREGLRRSVMTGLSRADYQPAVDGAPGLLTYLVGGQLHSVSLSPESELLLSAYLDQLGP
ncbi:hypothetical protein ACEZDB_32200 [Streptacidiphilus sp. N1-3]|uniref:Uncharacterized protein n=1 Tax=Streptacidiphilus alkalitolerans TaxID=3342712 RepID=A0ABV6XAN2_9ACTN